MTINKIADFLQVSLCRIKKIKLAASGPQIQISLFKLTFSNLACSQYTNCTGGQRLEAGGKRLQRLEARGWRPVWEGKYCIFIVKYNGWWHFSALLLHSYVIYQCFRSQGAEFARVLSRGTLRHLRERGRMEPILFISMSEPLHARGMFGEIHIMFPARGLRRLRALGSFRACWAFGKNGNYRRGPLGCSEGLLEPRHYIFCYIRALIQIILRSIVENSDHASIHTAGYFSQHGKK